jgi:hypothetical protein
MSGTVTVTAGQLAGPAMTAAELAALVAGVTAQVDEQAIGIVELANGSIPAAKLDPAIESQLGLDDGAVTTAKLGTACLSADGAGRLKMADGFVTAAEIAAGAVVEAKIKDGAVTAGKLADAVVTANFAYAEIGNAFTLSAGAWRDVTGLSVTITPRSAGSNILLMAMVTGGSNSYDSVALRFEKGGAAIGVGASAGSRTRCGAAVSGVTLAAACWSFVYAHGVTTALTFKVQAYHQDQTIYIGRSQADTNSNGYGRGICTLLALEVGA